MSKKEIIALIIAGLVLISLIAALIGVAVYEENKYNTWYNSLSEEEKLQVQREKEAEYNSRISRYKVLSVSQYVRTDTNNFGGIVDTEICYTFTYLDSNGNVKQVDNFQHLEYGLTKITVGDTNQYIVNANGETTRTLQLTKETLANIKINQNN